MMMMMGLASHSHVNSLLSLVVILFLKIPSQVATTVVDMAGSWDHLPHCYTNHSCCLFLSCSLLMVDMV